MNRRTVLRTVAVCATVGLAGCVDGVREHFQGEVTSPIPIEIFNEGNRTYNVQLEAQELETGRGTYDEGYTIRQGERVNAPRLEGTEQSLRVTRFGDADDDLVEAVTVTPETQVVMVTIYDDDLALEISSTETDRELEGNETDGEPIDGTESDDTLEDNDSNGSESSA